MMLCGLASTLDSGFAAAASLWAIDVKNSGGKNHRELAVDREEDERQATQEESAHGSEQKQVVGDGRVAMIGLAVLGLGVAFLVKEIFPLDRLWWLFNGVATIFVIPTVLSIYWKNLNVRGVIAGILLSLIGMVVFVYGNYVGNNQIVVWSALGILAANLLCCVGFSIAGRRIRA
jgi:Na+/proline symporter